MFYTLTEEEYRKLQHPEKVKNILRHFRSVLAESLVGRTRSEFNPGFTPIQFFLFDDLKRALDKAETEALKLCGPDE